MAHFLYIETLLARYLENCLCYGLDILYTNLGWGVDYLINPFGEFCQIVTELRLLPFLAFLCWNLVWQDISTIICANIWIFDTQIRNEM